MQFLNYSFFFCQLCFRFYLCDFCLVQNHTFTGFFSSEDFNILHLTFDSFGIRQPFASFPLYVNWHILSSFLDNCVRHRYFSILMFLPLLSLSLFMSEPYCLGSCGFLAVLENGISALKLLRHPSGFTNQCVGCPSRTVDLRIHFPYSRRRTWSLGQCEVLTSSW